MLRTNSWEEFKNSLIKNNRYHANTFNTKLFEQYCWAAPKIYAAGTKFYRGRISNKEGYSIEKMGCPPFKNSKAGRVNAEGVECLYLANNIETTINGIPHFGFWAIRHSQNLLQPLLAPRSNH